MFFGFDVVDVENVVHDVLGFGFDGFDFVVRKWESGGNVSGVL